MQLRRTGKWSPESKVDCELKIGVAVAAIWTQVASLYIEQERSRAEVDSVTSHSQERDLHGGFLLSMLAIPSSFAPCGQALLHQEMETLKRRRVELKRQSKQAAKDQKLLAAKRQRLLKATLQELSCLHGVVKHLRFFTIVAPTVHAVFSKKQFENVASLL